MRDLRGKVVVITGGSSGLGRAAAVAFSATGARVVVSARREQALRETVQACAGRASYFVADVVQEQEVLGLAELAYALFRLLVPKRLHV